MTRRLDAALVVVLIGVVAAAGCGGSETPQSTRTRTVTPSTTPPTSPTSESVLDGPSAVVVRRLPYGGQVLVAHDLDDEARPDS